MNKQDYYGPLRDQCMSIPALCEDQINGVKKGLLNTIPKETLKNIRRVIFTGCGDSYLAAGAAVPAFRQFAGAFASGFSAERNIDASRFMEISEKMAESTLIVAISASGGPKRVQEVLRRGNEKGCRTLVVTNNPESNAAKEAQYALFVNTPEFPNSSPGLRNYYANLTGLYMLGAYMGEAKGIAPEGSVDKLADAIREFTGAYAPLMEEMDDRMFELATEWKDFKGIDTIGDDIDFLSAYFIGAKFVEVAGTICATINSEDWCHVQTFAREPERIGTIVVAGKEFNNRSRIGETISQAVGMGRPVLLVSDGKKEDFSVGSDVGISEITLPRAPKGYEFLYPLLNYLPGSILASYVAALIGEPYFRRGAPGPHQDGANSIGTSEIVVV